MINSKWTVSKYFKATISDKDLAEALYDTDLWFTICDDQGTRVAVEVDMDKFFEKESLKPNKEYDRLMSLLKDTMLTSGDVKDFGKLLKELRIYNYDTLEVYF